MHFSVPSSVDFIHILSEEFLNIISLYLIAFYGRDYYIDAGGYENLRNLEGIIL